MNFKIAGYVSWGEPSLVVELGFRWRLWSDCKDHAFILSHFLTLWFNMHLTYIVVAFISQRSWSKFLYQESKHWGVAIDKTQQNYYLMQTCRTFCKCWKGARNRFTSELTVGKHVYHHSCLVMCCSQHFSTARSPPNKPPR